MTTHLMEEADAMGDRVAIIEHGRIIEMGKSSGSGVSIVRSERIL